ncbi:hypothetical protein Syun_019099 [Stephania yunnanensis]|uniref:Uncharacterized protein n=1 Tax=Stephania yunnanensis TaxID=152371 RepID=A0AAP0ITG3_9MAGN
MQYMDRYDYLRLFARDLVRDDSKDVYHFADGLRPKLGYHVVTTGIRTLTEIYESTLSHETYYLGRVADGTTPGPILSVERTMKYERRRQRGKGARKLSRHSRGSETATHHQPLVLHTSYPTPAQSKIGRPPLPPLVRLAFPSPTIPALPTPQAPQSSTIAPTWWQRSR